jgi:short-subunit dehydrogenase
VRKVVFLGATKGIGRSLARLLAARGDRLVLLGRDPEDLRRSAADLAARDGAGPGTAVCDLLRPETFGGALDEADRLLGGFDTVVVTAGLFGTQEALEADADARDRVLTADFTNTVHFCEAARERLLARGGGTLCVLSSVAGDRARKPVILYGAAKAGLSFYLAGLDAKFRDRGLKTVLVKPGFVRTGMTAGLPEPPFATDPDDVAPAIVKAIDRGTPEVYVPAVWRLVMFAVRQLPRAVMRKINF